MYRLELHLRLHSLFSSLPGTVPPHPLHWPLQIAQSLFIKRRIADVVNPIIWLLVIYEAAAVIRISRSTLASGNNYYLAPLLLPRSPSRLPLWAYILGVLWVHCAANQLARRSELSYAAAT